VLPSAPAMSESLRLVVEVDPDAEPIRGTVRDADGNSHAFVGWIALIGVLDDLRAAGALPCADEPVGADLRSGL
jgi:hypothetical protein